MAHGRDRPDEAGSRQNHKYGLYSEAKDVKSVKLTCNIAELCCLPATCSHVTPRPINFKMMEMIAVVLAAKQEELKLILL